MSVSACTAHLLNKCLAGMLYALSNVCREIANPYGDLKQNKFLQKTITIDVKNINSTSDAYQEVLRMIPERDQLLYEVSSRQISHHPVLLLCTCKGHHES